MLVRPEVLGSISLARPLANFVTKTILGFNTHLALFSTRVLGLVPNTLLFYEQKRKTGPGKCEPGHVGNQRKNYI